VDATTFQPQMIGDMSSGLSNQSLTDLAVDKDGKMVGITRDKLYSIDTNTGAVTLVKELTGAATNLTSLSYVPKDVNDPNSEDILVSANASGDVIQIDPANGTATVLGNYGMSGNEQISSSGDIVAVRMLNGNVAGVYATVNIGTDRTKDYFAQLDPTSGWKARPIATGTGYGKIFGLGFWAGKFYGFVDGGTGAGTIISLDKDTGKGAVLKAGTIEWYGAGVTTDAPILE
ncbi:MAG TPA: hypothetical protein VGC41_20730, partial [Kofleriaceae bacterium]